MSRNIFFVGLLLLMAVTFSYGLPKLANGFPQREWSSASRLNPPSPNEQCRNRKPGRYTGACKVSCPMQKCKSLKCVTGSRGDLPIAEDSGPALDYTWCGPKKVCYQGSCLPYYSTSLQDPFFLETYEECY